jgi:hypothetical protein
VRPSWVIVWAALASPGLGAEPPVVKLAAPAPALDALFERAEGWIGADGAHSSALSRGLGAAMPSGPGPQPAGLLRRGG